MRDVRDVTQEIRDKHVGTLSAVLYCMRYRRTEIGVLTVHVKARELSTELPTGL